MDSPASPDPQTPADDDTDEEYDYCPYPTYPETPSATALLARTERVTEGVRFDDGTKIAHPTNGVLVLVVVIRRRRRRRQRTTAAWWMSVPKQSSAHVRRAMNTCCMTHVADEVRGCFGVLMREAMEPAFLEDIVKQILQ